MALPQISLLLIALLLPFSLCSQEVTPQENLQSHIAYLMHTGDLVKALRAYQEYSQQNKSHDVDLLNRIGLALLDQGYRSRDPEVQVLTLFGAAISLNDQALYILEDALSSETPQIQLIALNFLARLHNDRADAALHKALSSNFLLIRFEAALHLATLKDKNAVNQTEALRIKLPEAVWPLFPQIYGLIGTPEAKKILRKLAAHPDELVRVATVISIAENGHDDLLPVVRRLASHHEPAQQEACASALGLLRDDGATKRLQELTRSKNPTVELAALASLYELGHKEVVPQIQNQALSGSPFATYQLGKIQGSETVLAKIATSPNAQNQVNAALALLERKDPRCAPLLLEILLRTPKDLALLEASSPGKSLTCYRIVPSAQQNFKDTPTLIELSLHNREQILAKAVELPEDLFIKIADAIFEMQQNDLVPALVTILENHRTPKVIELLKKHQQKAGAPQVRNYCNLALFRLKEEGPYADNLIAWVSQQQNVDLIRFRPLLSAEDRDLFTVQYELTPQETSRLLVEAFESFAQTQDDKAIDLLISVIHQGNAKNKYALIGLLMRAIQ